MDKDWYDSLTDAQKHVSVPVKLIGATKDPIARPDIQFEAMRLYVPDLTVEELPTGHWGQLERPNDMVESLRRFLH